jgi:hypothetical protein
MRKYRFGITYWLAALLVVFVTGCGQETVSIPGVVLVTPAQGATSVGLNATISATFNMAMSAASINTTTFTVVPLGGVPVTGTPTLDSTGKVATLVGATLAYGTTYTATITTGAATPGGAELIDNYVWTFSTAAAPLPPAPTVTATDPVTPSAVAPIVAEDVNVPLNQVVTASFSEPMAPDTIIGANFTLTVQGSSTLVPGSVSYVGPGNKLVFQLSPDVFLQPSTTYTATITTGVTDVAGTPMANPYTWNFMTTATGTNNTQPMLVTTVPADGALDVCQNMAISATFSEAMNKQTFTSSTFYIYLSTDPNKTPILGLYSYDATNFIETFTPTSTLVPGTYIATVTDGATNMAGIGLLVSATGPPPNPWTFTTNTSTCQPPVNLGVLAPFGGAAGAGGMTNTGDETVVNGEIATTAAASSVTGFYDESSSPAPGVYPCNYTAGVGANYGLVTTGITPPAVAIFTDAPPVSDALCLNEGNSTTYGIAQAALAQALATYNSLQSFNNPSIGTTPAAPQGPNTITADLGGTTLHPGVYWSSSTVGITSGDLTLDAQGDPTATFVFQVGSALTVGGTAPRSINLVHGAQASNIFWLCASAATINGAGGGTFNGTVIANATISTGTSGITTITTINGRLISLGLSSPSSSTTLVNTIVNVPVP